MSDISGYQQYPGQSPCPNCNDHSIIIKEEYFLKYFKKEEIICEKCNTPINWWKFLLDIVQTNLFSFGVLGSIGAKYSFKQIELHPNTKFKFDFGELGIPETAKILDVNYSPLGGNLFPIEMHGNRPIRFTFPHKITLIPTAFRDGEETTKTKVSIFVTWIENSEDDISWINLSKAFEYYARNPLSEKDFEDTIIPANVAVESKLSMLLNNYLTKFIGGNKVEEFLSNAATYSHQLNILIPLLIKEKKLYSIESEIIGNLNRLRKLRNEFAHNGKLLSSVNKEEVGGLLCSALFGFYYLRLIEEQMKT